MQRSLAVGSVLVAAIFFCGCTLEQEFSRTPRTAVEQLLLTQSIQHALHNLTPFLPEQASLRVDVTGLQTDRANLNMQGDQRGILNGPSNDLILIRDAVATGLGRLGYRIDSRDANPTYLARVVVESFGTTQGLTFFGMPPVQSYDDSDRASRTDDLQSGRTEGVFEAAPGFLRIRKREVRGIISNDHRPDLLQSVYSAVFL